MYVYMHTHTHTHVYMYTHTHTHTHTHVQTRPVTIYKLVSAGTVDEKIYNIAERKVPKKKIGTQGTQTKFSKGSMQCFLRVNVLW